MKNQFSLNIKSPCQENFNQFKATPDGGFCGTCKKDVIDFTNMNAQEVIAYFNLNSKENTCGVFKNNQLNKYKSEPQQRKKYGILSGVGLACLALFSITTMQAQDTKNETQTTKITNSITQENFIVKGNVFDEQEPIPGVNVVLEGTKIGTVTDFDGNFEFPKKLKKGDVLVFSYVGMQSQKLIIEDKTSASDVALSVNMVLDPVIIMGKVAVKGVYKSNKRK